MNIEDHIEKINAALVREDAQEFMQIINLTNWGELPRVLFVPAGACFLAEVRFRKPGKKRDSCLLAEGESRSEALEALAGKVAAALYPVR